MGVLSNLGEGLVYELILVTRSNVTPVGVVRRDDTLNFKLFPGRSFRELLQNPRVAVQITNDPEMLVRTALNLPIKLEFEESGEYRWIRGLPGWLGKVECGVEPWRDSLGETKVLRCTLLPEEKLPGELPLRPFSRTDCLLVEMAVLFTRYLLIRSPELREEILKLYATYRHLGGSSESAEYMVSHLD